MTAFERVQAARAKGRATSLDFIRRLFDGFLEMHGDRRFGDDRAIIAGLATLGGQPVTVIGIEKGHDARERALRNFGCAAPEGYRKALRQMRLAEKFGRPVVCLIDTSGAQCADGAEERGQGLAIAENLMEMSALRMPIISLLIGEGGSGGALALAVADEVWILENAVYSVISPEGCASILWKDGKRAAEAAEALQMTAQDLLRQGVVDRVLPENDELYDELKRDLADALARLKRLSPTELVNRRYSKYR
ncbi:MAG: acetyl-CoA carboxylase carboxyl transferase subunit alpha [Oscillospiraceae bacterium]|jgi:acetyl-CoA carboxylase carboxyl transferase subunit alpha|nr:acetyl-CoA carboxylase carboxyl transferase subunit alpha [Oscillospiraceae bacterium]